MDGDREVRDMPVDPSRRPIRRTSDILQEFVKRQQERMTSKQRQIVADALDVARAWLDGQLPLAEAMRLTGDGWLRMKVGHGVSGEDALIWQRFIESVLEERDSECRYGIETPSGFLSAQEIADHGGRMEQTFDPVTQRVRCVVRWPHVELDRPASQPRNDGLVGGSGRSPSMVEWME